MESRNQYDYSSASNSITLLCAFISATPASVTTVMEGIQVKVSWNLPTDNGSPLTSYKVYIKEIGTDVYTEESSDCDGTDSTVITNEYCHINISTLIAAPYNVDGGDSIYAKVVAVNLYGETD